MRQEPDHLARQLRELVDAHILGEDSTHQFVFRHVLTRDAVYQGILGRERKRYHHVVARTIEGLALADKEGAGGNEELVDTSLADLALHYYEAGDWPKAIEYSLQAGERAQATYAPHEAVDYFTRALDAVAAEQGEPSPPLLRARGQAHETLGQFGKAQADYEFALRQARQTGQPQSEWQSLLDLGYLWSSRDYSKSGEYFQEALHFARATGDPLMLGHSLNRVGNWYMNIDLPFEGLRIHQEALDIFQMLNDPGGLAETYDLLGITSFEACDFVSGARYYENAIRRFRELGNLPGLSSSLANLSACASTYWSDFVVPAPISLGVAAQMAEEAQRLASEMGWRAGEAFAAGQLGSLLGSQGDYGRALECARSSLAIAEEIDHHQWICLGKLGLGWLYRDLLALDKADACLREAVQLARQVQSTLLTSVTSGVWASICIEQGKLDQAESILDAALDTQPERTERLIARPEDWSTLSIGQRICVGCYAALALAQGEPERSLSVVDGLLRSTPNLSEKAVIPHLEQLRAEAHCQLRRFEPADSLLLQVQRHLEARGDQSTLWRVHVLLARLYQIQGDLPREGNELATARAIVEKLSASVKDPELREGFRARAIETR